MNLSHLSLINTLNKLTDMVFIMEVENELPKHYVYANESTIKVTGLSPDSIVGKTVHEVFQQHPKMTETIYNNYKLVVKQQQTATYKGRFNTPNGEIIYTETLLDPIHDLDGNVTHVLALVRNITKLIQQQELIEEKNNRLLEVEQHYQSIVENNIDGIWYTNKNWELVRANQSLRDMLGASSDKELIEIREMVLKKLPPEELAKIRNYQNLVMQGFAQEYETYFFRLDGEKIDVHVKASPVYIHGEIEGLYGIAKEITEQKRIEKELRESEERYRKLTELSPEAVIVHQHGKIIYANPAVYKVLRVKDNDTLIGRSVIDFVHPEDRAMVISRINVTQVEKEIADTLEERFITESGDTINGEATAVPITYNEETATLVIVRDITERKTREKELQEARNRLRLYWNHVSDAVFSIGYDGTIIDVNPAFTEMLGFTADELRGMSNLPIFTDEMEMVRAKFLLDDFHKGIDITDLRTIRKTKDGLYKTVLASYKAVNQDNILAIGIYRDITEQIRIQQQLEDSEEMYRSLFDYNKDAIWSLDLNGNFTSANPAYEKILGLSPEILVELNLTDFEEVIITPFEDIFKNIEEVKKGKSVEYDLSMYGASGDIVHLTITNVPIYKNGEIVGIYGIGKDVTEEFNAEIALRESENRYRLIAENMNDLIVMFNLNGIITYASPSYRHVLNIDPNDYIGNHVLSLIHVDDHQSIISSFESAKQKQSSFTIELRKKKNSDDWLYFETVCMPIFNDQQKIEHFVGVSRNITDRKAAETAVLESQERYRLIAENSHDLIRVTNLDQETIYVSPSHQAVLGYTPEEALQRDLFSRVHSVDLEAVKAKFNKVIQEKKPYKIEFRSQHANGEWIWLESVATPVLEDEKIQHIIIVSRDISQRKYYEEKLKHLAYHDTLTNLPNRRLFNKLAEQSLKEALRTKRKVGIMYLDLDNFKEINDNLGHDVGDELLVQFTTRIKKSIRGMDIVARMGGDEFIILLPYTEKLYVKVIAQRILQAIQKPFNLNGHDVIATSSIGVSIYPENGEKVEELIKQADQAMYKAKESGRNNIYLADMINNKF